MFALAILIGVYSYLIFLLGIFHVFFKEWIFIVTAAICLFSILYYKKTLHIFLKSFKKLRQIRVVKIIRLIKNNKLVVALIIILSIQVIVNLVGALGPELAFDALWYHLTIPRIYLLEHKVFFIPGGLLYYSAMPKLIEMLYVAGLAFGNEIIPKLIHFSFGILCLIALYKLSRMFFSKTISLLVLVVFYANLVVAWESTTAYIDLGRTFYEIMALWAFLLWEKSGKQKDLIVSAIMIGLAISSKLLALGSLGIFIVLIIYKNLSLRGKTNEALPAACLPARQGRQESHIATTNILIYSFTTLLVVLPWLLFAYVNTGNPIFPFFSGYKMDIASDILSPISFFISMKKLFLFADDPMSPVYIICLPLVILLFKKFRSLMKLMVVYSVLALLIWYFTPRTGGGRFIMPYLPGFSLVVEGVIDYYKKNKVMYFVLLSLVVFVSTTSILFRGIANKKYIPVVFGKESKGEFLTKNLNFSFGDFYDTDHYFSAHITSSDKVLLYGFHNLYYVDFSFIDNSWMKPGDKFNYIATQHTSLPKKFAEWGMIYENKRTGVRLFKR